MTKRRSASLTGKPAEMQVETTIAVFAMAAQAKSLEAVKARFRNMRIITTMPPLNKIIG